MEHSAMSLYILLSQNKNFICFVGVRNVDRVVLNLG